MADEKDRASQGLSEGDYPPGDGAGDGLVFPPCHVYVMSDEQVVTIEGLRRDLATAVAQAGLEHVALNEIKELKAHLDNAKARILKLEGLLDQDKVALLGQLGKVEAYATRLAEVSDSPTGNLIGRELLRLLAKE